MVVGGVPTPFEVEVVDLSGNGHHCTNKSNGIVSFIQGLPDLTNRLGPRQLFIKPGNSLNPKFL